jgi:hypothetical protein
MVWKIAKPVLIAVLAARYQVENPASRSLDAFIKDDKTSFVETSAEVLITELEPLTTGDGQKLRSLSYFRPKDKNWERVSYGEEAITIWYSLLTHTAIPVIAPIRLCIDI